MSESLNNKELVAAGHQFARLMSSDTALIDIAKMITRLAERLDITAAALREKSKQCDQLAAENAARKSAAKKVIKMNRQHAKDKHGNPDIAESWACVKALRQVSTPATDAWQREQLAVGVEMFADNLKVVGRHEHPYSTVAKEYAAQLRNGEAVWLSAV